MSVSCSTSTLQTSGSSEVLPSKSFSLRLSSLPLGEATVLPTLLEDMRFIGFDLTNLGNNSYAINGLPAGVENLDPVSLIRNMVDRVIDTGCEVHEEICDSLALSLAKAAAIRPGKILSGEEMDNLLASLFSCQESNLTPDGKTIISKLTDEELEKRFK